MAVKVFTIANFSQSSTWRVDSRYNTMLGDYENYLVSGPSTVSVNKAVVFSGIPAGSTINSAVLTATIGGTAFKIRQLDDAYFSGSRNVSPKVSPGASVNFKFTFQGSGSLSTVGTITSYLAYSNIKIVIDYTEPASGLTLNKTTCKAGDSIRATIAPVATTATHKLKYAMSGITTVVSSLIPAGTKVFDYDIPLDWQNAMPNNATRVVTVTLETYAGATLTGTDEKTFTLNLSDDAYPSIGGISATLNSNGVPSVITKYVQGKSKALVEVSGAAGAYGSTIASYRITGNDQVFNASTGSFGPFSAPGEVVFTATVTDSRGRTASATVSIVVDAYAMPGLMNPVVFRSNETGTKDHKGQYISVKSGIKFSPVSNENTAILEVCYGIKGGVMTPWALITKDVQSVMGGGLILTTNTYEVWLRVSDTVGEIYVYTAVIPTATAGLNLIKDQNGVITACAIGKYAETPGVLDIAYSQGLVGGNPLAFYPVGSVYISTVSTNPGSIFGGTWSALAAGKVLVGVDPNDSDFTAGVAGGSKTGAVTGIAKLGVSSTSLWVKRKTQSWTADGKGTLAGALANNTDNLSSGIELDATASTLQPYLPVYIWTRTE